MFFNPDLTYVSVNGLEEKLHHWCPLSEQFAVTSQLVSALLTGWQMNSVVIRRTYTLGRARQTHIYYVELLRAGTYMTMPVCESPSLLTLLDSNNLDIFLYGSMPEYGYAGKRKREVAAQAS